MDEQKNEPKNIVMALIDERAFLCGVCGHKIGSTVGFRGGLGNGKIFLICKHKERGKVCRTTNQIDL